MKAGLTGGQLVIKRVGFMDNFEVEEYILQTLSGIIPKELWDEHSGSDSSPFDRLSEAEARVVKRKFRKLKKKAKVKKYNSAKSMWSSINYYLKGIKNGQ